MAKKTTTKSKPEVAAKGATKSAAPVEKPKAVSAEKPKTAPPEKTKATPPPKAATAPAPVVSELPKTAPKAKRVVKKAAPKPPAYSQEDVALRAYFISEKRRAEGLPGDEHQDWLEAERQIAAEVAKKKPAKKA